MTVRPNDKILYVGMNKYASYEGANLDKVAKADVKVVKDVKLPRGSRTPSPAPFSAPSDTWRPSR